MTPYERHTRDRFNAARDRRQNPLAAFERELDQRLASRKALRQQRSDAAKRGHITGKGAAA